MASSFHHLFTFQYHAPYLDLGSENEVCRVFIGLSDEPPRPNPNEIADTRWISPYDLDREFEEQPAKFTPWFTIEWPRVRASYREILAIG